MTFTNILEIATFFSDDELIMLFVKIVIILSLACFAIKNLIIPTIDVILDSIDKRKRKEINNQKGCKALFLLLMIAFITHKHFNVKNVKNK